MLKCEPEEVIRAELNNIYLDIIVINQFINKTNAVGSDPSPLGKFT
jgi:hypothetical protein